MKTNGAISDKWLKASIMGTVWASSEIVLGSFLHNLRIPFSGSILTMIGMSILISASYVWKEKGLFWRAGLICALMKTMSPSAVIFGPMIAIFSEALLMEISVRLFGNNYAGFFTGSILASTWSFIQRIFNFLIFYGFNIIDLYKNLVKYAEKQFNFHFETVWIPILMLLLVYVMLGIITAIIGIRTGKKTISQPLVFKPDMLTNNPDIKPSTTKKQINYSLGWLVADILLIISALVVISLTDWKIWMTASTLVVILWVVKYKRALRQLSKPKFWIYFVLITMLTALVFTKMQSKSMFDAFLIGLEMNFRATVLIIGFSVLGAELYNPKIREFFNRTRFQQLPLALELSAQSLPLVIANIPDAKTIFKNPVSVISNLIAYSEYRFKELQNAVSPHKFFVLTGPVASGKTSAIKRIIHLLKEQNISVGGIYSPKIFEGDERIGYDIVDIQSQRQEPFLRKNKESNIHDIGPFSILPQGLKLGLESLNPDYLNNIQLVIIDEIGKLELENQGWADEINHLVKSKQHVVLMVVREKHLSQVVEKWELSRVTVFNIAEADDLKVVKSILESIQDSGKTC